MSDDIDVVGSFKSPPHRSAHSKAYWDGLQSGKLVFQKCRDCGAFTHPPGPACTTCLSTNREHVALSGRGALYTYTIAHRAMNAEFKVDLPYVIAYVRLAEGPMIVSWLVDVDPQAIRIDMPVQATFEKIDDRTHLHRFRPAAA